MADSSLEAPAPHPARRLSRPALGLGLLVVVLFVTSAALVITAPGARAPRAQGPDPKDQKQALATFLNHPPRQPSPEAPPSPDRIEELLRAARQQAQSSGAGPLSFLGGAPAPEAASFS